MMSILLTYKVTDVYVRLVCMHVIYLPVSTSFAAAVAVSPFPSPPASHVKQVLEVKNCNTLYFSSLMMMFLLDTGCSILPYDDLRIAVLL